MSFQRKAVITRGRSRLFDELPGWNSGWFRAAVRRGFERKPRWATHAGDLAVAAAELDLRQPRMTMLSPGSVCEEDLAAAKNHVEMYEDQWL